MLFKLYYTLGVLTLSFYQWSSCANPRGFCHEGSRRVVVTCVLCPQVTSGPSRKTWASWSANLARRCRCTFDRSFEITVANDARNSSVERVIHTLPRVWVGGKNQKALPRFDRESQVTLGPHSLRGARSPSQDRGRGFL